MVQIAILHSKYWVLVCLCILVDTVWVVLHLWDGMGLGHTSLMNLDLISD